MKTTKGLKLDTVWDRCIAMAEFVAKWHEERGLAPRLLKRMWLSANGYEPSDVYNLCLFCDYADRHTPDTAQTICPRCPGRAVDKSFNCRIESYHWRYNPAAFANKLKKMNAKRKEN